MLGSACLEGNELSAGDKLVTNYSSCHGVGALSLQPHPAWRGRGVETLILAVKGVRMLHQMQNLFLYLLSQVTEKCYSPGPSLSITHMETFTQNKIFPH